MQSHAIQPATRLSLPVALACSLLAVVAVLISLTNILIAWQLQVAYYRLDDWYLYAEYLRLEPLEFILQKHINHTMIPTKLALVGSLHFLSGTTGALLATGMALNIVTAAILCATLWCYRGTASIATSLLACGLVAGSIFWMVRGHEFTVIHLLTHPMALTAITIAGFSLFRHLAIQGGNAGLPTDRWWWLMLLMCIFSTFNFSAGFATWPGVAVIMLIYGVPLRRIVPMLTVGTVCVILAMLTPGHPLLDRILADAGMESMYDMLPTPLEFITYLAGLFGMAFNFSVFPFNEFDTGSPLFSRLIGGAGIVTLLIYSWRLYRTENQLEPLPALPLTIAWFGLFTGLALALGRAGAMEGIDSPNSLRLALWSVMLWIPLVWLGCYHYLQRPASTPAARAGFLLAAALLCAVFGGATYHTVDHLKDGHRENRLAGLSMIVAPEMRAGHSGYLTPLGLVRSWEKIDPMRERGHNLFAEPWTHLIGESLSEHYTITTHPECQGVWHWRRDMQRRRSRGYEGWAIGPNGSFDTLLLVGDDIILGGAKPVWVGDPRELTGNTMNAPGPVRYFAGMLLGHNPGWLGIANMSPVSPRTEVHIYGMFDKNTVCYVRKQGA